MKINVDDICKTEFFSPPISFFTAIVSAILIVFTVPANSLILISIVKYERLLHRNFYFVIANIAIADLMCGLLVGPLSMNHHFKEGLGKNVTLPIAQVRSLHLSFFITNVVSVLSMAWLSVDRLGVLLNPFYYYEKVTRVRAVFILVLTWVLSIAISSFYFWLGYIRYLTIFAIITVMLTMLVMIVTMAIFKYRLVRSERYETRITGLKGSQDLDKKMDSKKKRRQSLHHFTPVDQRITKTFLWMLLLFLGNYFPASVVAAYINICTACHCGIVHVMRDIVFLPILTSGLWRAILFMTRLKLLRETVKSVLHLKKQEVPKETGNFNSSKC